MNIQARIKTEAAAHIAVADVRLLADPAGVLVHETERLLVVADLHFEKGSAFASRRQLLPPYDTAATLARLTRLIMRHDPKTVVALGDSFHDIRAGERISPVDRAALKALMQRRQWIWIAGNHDPAMPQDIGGEMLETLRVGALTFRHEPQAGEAHGEIAGHLHPAARVTSPSGSVRRRCFVGDGSRCVMPAFGAYAGGLNIRDRAFAPLFGRQTPTAHVLGRSRVYAVGMSACGHD
ncbi:MULTISPECIES: ligase-associated DNA damage response endonuclease PdeM [unclassified Beijerinckia]|uniref:ligase-associated DNA damage response endonuclease PdeM n=1 Tax=unclassified Beijerinckia TaxID=2638183 RepID=UPI0008993869|nr:MULTISPECIES: ligase-associated DNA damage response endonuclease PdeM [unclassified Beijerinckia]MDH7797355.1 DNA ligase-associated metallophosphoesterase [Beijerinckia sp. GAS462]SEC82269.1 putative phosphoesterase [Beijerinckia sp. 28-YEA-48]